MSDYRSDAEKFVTDFVDYVYKHDILDEYNKRTGKMERSVGVDTLIKRAEAIFPRAKDGKAETDKLSEADRDAAIAATSNVIDTREMFGRKMQLNGGTRKLLRDLYSGEPEARERVADFLAAEDGQKEFAKE